MQVLLPSRPSQVWHQERKRGVAGFEADCAPNSEKGASPVLFSVGLLPKRDDPELIAVVVPEAFAVAVPKGDSLFSAGFAPPKRP
ncbi:hypothetical protein OXX80_014278, partial [Metschnikowia pulcherrima]